MKKEYIINEMLETAEKPERDVNVYPGSDAIGIAYDAEHGMTTVYEKDERGSILWKSDFQDFAIAKEKAIKCYKYIVQSYARYLQSQKKRTQEKTNVIELNILGVMASMEEIIATALLPVFLPIYNTRGSNYEKLIEIRDRNQSFIRYNKQERMLEIEINAKQETSDVKATLKKPNGTLQPIEFSKSGNTFYAKVCNLADGDYEIKLEQL